MLSYNDIVSIMTQAPAAPTLQPTSASIGPYECPVCLTFQPNLMLTHTKCMRTICAQDLLNLLNAGSDCPVCRDPLRQNNWDWTSNLNIRRPPPNDIYWMERVLYECTYCAQSFQFEEAKEHPADCDDINQLRHQPPAHIGPRTSRRTEFVEVISNPKADVRNMSSERLLIHHFNGRQIVTKFTPQRKNIAFVKSQLANITGVNANAFKIYKFIHLELSDSQLVGDVASGPGSTYLSSFSNHQNLGVSTANLILEEVGPPPVVPPPQQGLIPHNDVVEEMW